jgi:hypothetical protein
VLVRQARTVKWWQQAARIFLTFFSKGHRSLTAITGLKGFSHLPASGCGKTRMCPFGICPSATTCQSCKTMVMMCLTNRLSTIWQSTSHPSETALGLKTNTGTTATKKDATKVVKSLVTDTEIDKKMKGMFLLSRAMFAMTANYIISTSLLRHPKQFAGIIDGRRPSPASFKQAPTAAAMKNYILSSYEETQENRNKQKKNEWFKISLGFSLIFLTYIFDIMFWCINAVTQC